MTSFEKWVSDSTSKYQLARTILNESKYYASPQVHPRIEEAKGVLLELLEDLESKFKEKDHLQVLAVKALLTFHIGSIKVLNKEIDSGIATLSKSWELIKDVSRNPEYCFLALSILNHIGFYLWGNSSYKKAAQFLKEAEFLYHDYKENSSTCPRDAGDIFRVDSEKKESWDAFEVGYSTTLFSLAKLSELLDEVENAAKYSQMFLSRHKGFVEFDAEDWVFKTASLSNFYVMKKDYPTAKHILSCASYILSLQEASSDDSQDQNRVLCIKSFLSLCWVIYFRFSLTDFTNELEPKILVKALTLYNNPEVLELERRASLSVTTFNAARDVFLFAQSHVKQAEQYHTFINDPVNYILLKLSHCKLYEFLIRFENDLGRVSKLHKRRIDILEHVLSQISLQTYPSEWQSMLFMLGSAYSSLARPKLELLKLIPNDQRKGAIQKLKALSFKASGCFERYLESLKDENGAFPRVFSDDVVKNALEARICYSGLNGQISILDPSHSGKRNNLDKWLRVIFQYANLPDF